MPTIRTREFFDPFTITFDEDGVSGFVTLVPDFDFDGDTPACPYEPDHYGAMMADMLATEVPDMGDEPTLISSRRAYLSSPNCHHYSLAERTHCNRARWNGRGNK